jgi:endonuclease V-like protein UPF0215 family
MLNYQLGIIVTLRLALVIKRFRVIKPEIRVLGIDDGKHVFRSKTRVPIVGVVYRGGLWLDGVMSTSVLVDGFDATEAVSKMITSSRHYKQLRVIMLSGVTYAGFNIIDIVALNETTKLPVIAITREKPNLDRIRLALGNLERSEERFNTLLRAGEIVNVKINGNKIFMQTAGILCEDAQKIVALTSTRSSIPEPLRVAHLIASGTSFCDDAIRKSLKATKQS